MAVTLIALKRLSHRQRRIKAGQEFVASRTEAPGLIAVGLARKVDVMECRAKKVLVPRADLTLRADGNIPELRARYEQLAGAAPDKRWGLHRLAQEVGALESAPKIEESEESVEAEKADDVHSLRAEYERLSGYPADKRWGVAKLKSELAVLEDDADDDDESDDEGEGDGY